MTMRLRSKRLVVLVMVAALFILSILDVTFRKEELFERFGDVFENEQRTVAHDQVQSTVSLTEQRQLELKLSGVREVALATVRNKLTVQRSTDAGMRLNYTVTVKAPDALAARRLMDSVQVKDQVDQGVLNLRPEANGRKLDMDGVSVEYVLTVPDGVKLQLQNERGTLAVTGVQSEIVVSSEGGLVEVVGTSGPLDIKTSRGHVYMQDIKGEIQLSNHNSQVVLTNGTGGMTLQSESGRNVIERMIGNVTGTLRGGQIQVREVTGTLELRSGGSAGTLVERVEGNIRIESEGDANTLILPETVGYALDVQVSGGAIRTTLPYPIERLKDGEYSTRMKGTIGKGTWNVVVKSRGGDVLIHSN
jgi:hypothetical protein